MALKTSGLVGAKCAAYGCQNVPKKDCAFCSPHWRKLPEILRGPSAVKQAITELAIQDGYLVRDTPRPVRLTDQKGKGSEYV